MHCQNQNSNNLLQQISYPIWRTRLLALFLLTLYAFSVTSNAFLCQEGKKVIVKQETFIEADDDATFDFHVSRLVKSEKSSIKSFAPISTAVFNKVAFYFEVLNSQSLVIQFFSLIPSIFASEKLRYLLHLTLRL